MRAQCAKFFFKLIIKAKQICKSWTGFANLLLRREFGRVGFSTNRNR